MVQIIEFISGDPQMIQQIQKETRKEKMKMIRLNLCETNKIDQISI